MELIELRRSEKSPVTKQLGDAIEDLMLMNMIVARLTSLSIRMLNVLFRTNCRNSFERNSAINSDGYRTELELRFGVE